MNTFRGIIRGVFGFVGYPVHWPKRYNANSEPCDMLDGPCSCGAWHDIDDNWAKTMIPTYGLEKVDDPMVGAKRRTDDNLKEFFT